MIPPHVWMVEFGGHCPQEGDEEPAPYFPYYGYKYDLARLMAIEMPFFRRCDNSPSLSQWLEQHKTFPPPRHSPTMLVNTNAKANGWRNGYGDDDWGIQSPTYTRSFTPTRLEGSIRDDSSEDSYHSSTSGGAKDKRSFTFPFPLEPPFLRNHGVRYQNPTYLNQSDPNFGKRSHLGGGYQRGRLRKFGSRPQPMYHQPAYTTPDRFLSHGHLVHVSTVPAEYADFRGDKLSESIWKMFIMKQQSLDTYKQKILLWKDLFLFLRSVHKWGLFLVGSTMSGLGLNTSDMDMCLVVRTTEVDQRNEALLLLGHLVQYLRQCDFINHVELIQAKVPILKLKSSGFEIDLNCNNAVGIRNTHLLYCYARADWRVRPLVLIVKLWAAQHNINDAKRMTVSSYSWALMVIHYLQCGTKPSVLPCLQHLYQDKFLSYSDINQIDLHEDVAVTRSTNRDSLGQLLLGFLKYYDEFEFTKFAVSVRVACKIPIEECRHARSAKNDPHQWKFLCIEEPFDLTNTARSVYDFGAFERVRRVVGASYERLKATCKLDSLFDHQFRPL